MCGGGISAYSRTGKEWGGDKMFKMRDQFCHCFTGIKTFPIRGAIRCQAADFPRHSFNAIITVYDRRKLKALPFGVRTSVLLRYQTVAP